MRTKASYLLVAIALASCAAAYAALSDGHDRRAAVVTMKAEGTSKVSVSGHVGGLFPGARKGIPLKVRNRSRQWAVIRTVRADVEPGASGCSPDYLSTVPKDLAYPRIRPHKTRRVGVRIRMWHGAPNACQGVKLPLRFKVRAGR